MTPLFTKLNLKDEGRIAVLNAPDEFAPALRDLSAASPALELTTEAAPGSGLRWGLAFAPSAALRDRYAAELAAALEGDAVLWIAYPKGGSKRYRCDYNRDGDWSALEDAGFRPVRQVAIDEDWSALRFRRSSFVRT